MKFSTYYIKLLGGCNMLYFKQHTLRQRIRTIVRVSQTLLAKINKGGKQELNLQTAYQEEEARQSYIHNNNNYNQSIERKLRQK